MHETWFVMGRRCAYIVSVLHDMTRARRVASTSPPRRVAHGSAPRSNHVGRADVHTAALLWLGFRLCQALCPWPKTVNGRRDSVPAPPDASRPWHSDTAVFVIWRRETEKTGPLAFFGRFCSRTSKGPFSSVSQRQIKNWMVSECHGRRASGEAGPESRRALFLFFGNGNSQWGRRNNQPEKRQSVDVSETCP